MNEEFDYDLTPDQWEALKALRTPASRLPRMSRYTIDGLIALELAAMNGDVSGHHGEGTQGADSRLVAAVAGSGGLIRSIAPQHNFLIDREKIELPLPQAGRCPHTGFSSSVTGDVITRNTRSTSPEFEIACSTPGGRKMKSCLRTTWFLPAISISPSPSST